MSAAHSQAHIVTSVIAFESHFAKQRRTHLTLSETLPPARISRQTLESSTTTATAKCFTLQFQ